MICYGVDDEIRGVVKKRVISEIGKNLEILY
jgi:hypothetical protein